MEPTDHAATPPAEPSPVEPSTVSLSASSRTAQRRSGRTWPQRSLLALNCLVIVACFGGAGGLLVARYYSNSIGRVTLQSPPTTTATTSASTVGDSSGSDPAATDPQSTVPDETFPPADPGAKNYLVTGADNHSCVDPNSKYAAAFGNREGMGERSDTIMVLRIDPSASQAAVLSFPRDLWVDIAGRGSKQRINTAYVKDDPQRLIDTIYMNFGIGVDHFVQIDFCAFKNIVDAIGGVAIPFEYPTRDVNTGLDVPTKGCFTFDGDHALAYVRSRKYQYMTDDGKWRTDGVSDLGRISRQQDFIRRTLSATLDKGLLSPNLARGLIETAEQNVVVDADLSAATLLKLAGAIRSLEPGAISTYQVEGAGRKISGNSVLVPQIKGKNMSAILDIFRGKAPLAGAPVQVFETTLPPTTLTPTTVTLTTVKGSSNGATATTSATGTTKTTSTTSTTTTSTTAPMPTTTVEAPEENVKGIVPPRDVLCKA